MEKLGLEHAESTEQPTAHPNNELPSRYTPSIHILGHGAAEITFIGDDGRQYFDC